MFFYYVIFNLVVVIYSNVYRNLYSIPEKCDSKKCPSVAVLYLTRNDFNESACLSCLNQKYNNFKVFILDDSHGTEIMQSIDVFSSKVSGKVKVIRRTDKTGFKAGNINHALNLIHKEFEYFIISDSDGILPEDFITECLPYFELDATIGFVQASCAYNPNQNGLFSNDMAPQVNIHWKHFMPYHNSFGFVMFYGHSGMIKTEVWEKIGGMPEVVSEDLFFSIKAREAGFQGIVAENVVTFEDVPENYHRFRNRHEKWVRGTTEFLRHHTGTLLKSKHIPWFEKLDLFSCAFSMLMSAPFILFILLIAFMLPYYFKAFNLAGATFLMPLAMTGKQASDYLSGFRYNMYWSIDFYIMIALGLIYPVFPALAELRNYPKKLFNYLFISTGIYTSLTISTTLSIISYILTGKTYFPVTGDRHLSQKLELSLFDFKNDTFKVKLIELLLAFLLAYISFKSHNLWFLPLSIGSICAVLLMTARYESVRLWLYVPFLMQIGLILLVGKNFIS